MRKIFLSILLFFSIFQCGYSKTTLDNTKIENNIQNDVCDGCILEDDEYCIYNQCYFDKTYRKMKRELNLTARQEKCIDNIYRNFKSDMERTHYKYRLEKNKLLEKLACDVDSVREEKSIMKEIKKESKEKYKDFIVEIKEILCKRQYSTFKAFERNEKRKIKKISKYSIVYKLPCVGCCR